MGNGQSNKFVQELETEQIEKEEDEQKSPMDDLYHTLTSNGMDLVKTVDLMLYLQTNEYNSDSARNDLSASDIFGNVLQSNICSKFQLSKFITKVMKKHLDLKGNDDDNIPVFSFGEKFIFCSWKHFKIQIVEGRVVEQCHLPNGYQDISQSIVQSIFVCDIQSRKEIKSK